MKVDQPLRFKESDYPDADPWFHRFSDLLNSILEGHARALQGNIDEHNLREEVRELSVRHLENFEITLQRLRVQPRVAVVVWVEGLRDHYPLVWEPLAGQRIRARLRFFADPGEAVTIRVLVK